SRSASRLAWRRDRRAWTRVVTVWSHPQRCAKLYIRTCVASRSCSARLLASGAPSRFCQSGRNNSGGIMTPVPFDSSLDVYQAQAEKLLFGWRERDKNSLEIIRHRHPRFLDERVKWLPKQLSDDELLRSPFDLADAQLVVARWYGFADWQ